MDSSPNSLHSTISGGGVPSPRSYALTGKIMLSAIIILFSIVLLIVFLHFYVRWNVLRRATRRARRRRRRFIFTGQDHSAPANRALDPAILKSLPVLLYTPDAVDDDEQEECDCAVCLNEFEDGQKIRSLPRCGHSFHVECIDMWFSSHSNCPLCRAAVEAVLPTADLSPSPDSYSSCQPQEDTGPSSSDSRIGEVAIEMPTGGVEGLIRQPQQIGVGQALKWPISRVVLLQRFLSLNVRPNRVGTSEPGPDLESGQGAALPSPAE